MKHIGAAILAIVFMAGQAAAAERTMRIAVAVLPATTGHPYQGVTLPAVLALHGLYDTLTALDSTGSPVPSLATAWRPDGPSDWIFTLRPGVTFSNGEPFDAAAVAASAAHLASRLGRSETIGSTLYQVTRADVIDPLTVRIALSEPDPLFPLHASVWRIAAPQLWAKVGGQGELYAETSVGTGPFVLEAREKSRVSLRRNPASWRSAKLDGVEIILAAEEVSRLQALTSGAVDVAFGLAPETRQSVEAVGGRLIQRPTTQVHFIAFVTMQPRSALSDPRVRRALNMAVNRQRLIDQVLAGSTVPASQLAVPEAFGFADDLQPLPYDPKAARKLLAEAGFADGFALRMGVSQGRGAGELLVFQQIAADLLEVGVRVELNMRPTARLQLELFTGKLDVDLLNQFTRGHDPIMDYRHRSCIGVVADRRPYHCDPRISALAKQAIAETDLERRRMLYTQVARAEQESPPGILLWQGVDFDGVGKRVKAYAPVQEVMNLHDWDLHAASQ